MHLVPLKLHMYISLMIKDKLVYRGAIDDNARNESNVEEAFL